LAVGLGWATVQEQGQSHAPRGRDSKKRALVKEHWSGQNWGGEGGVEAAVVGRSLDGRGQDGSTRQQRHHGGRCCRGTCRPAGPDLPPLVQ